MNGYHDLSSQFHQRRRLREIFQRAIRSRHQKIKDITILICKLVSNYSHDGRSINEYLNHDSLSKSNVKKVNSFINSHFMFAFYILEQEKFQIV